jgi:hypothetical protein
MKMRRKCFVPVYVDWYDVYLYAQPGGQVAKKCSFSSRTELAMYQLADEWLFPWHMREVFMVTEWRDKKGRRQRAQQCLIRNGTLDPDLTPAPRE